MDNIPLWLKVISSLKNRKIIDSGVSIPYMVGVYYLKSLIHDLESQDCIRTVLTNIINTVEHGNEVAIFSCDAYSPHIHIIQMLNDRSSIEIEKVKKSNPYLSNPLGQPVIYLQMNGIISPYNMDVLTEYLWNKYNKPIRQKNFSVVRTNSLQHDGTFNKWGEIKEEW